MTDSSTLTVRLTNQTKDQLAALADRTRHTQSFLAAKAIADYVTRELAVMEAVENGRADVRAGRLTSHEDVAREARDVIEAARASQ